MSFEYYDPANIQFGVRRGVLGQSDCVIIPVDTSVKTVLQQMIEETRRGIGIDEVGAELSLPQYEPSEDYTTDSRVSLPLISPLASVVRAFYERENLPVEPAALRESQTISAYFCIVHDQKQNKLLAMKRASQFKAVLKAHLISFIDDTLQAVGDDVFKLDSAFDFVVADDTIFALHIAGFEKIAEMDDAVQSAAIANVAKLATTLPSIEFGGLSTYVGRHKRAARIVASLCTRDDLASISVTNLKRECKRSGVAVQTVDGKLRADAGNEMAFLQMFDRRRYAVSLIPGRWEQYEAGSRKGVGVRKREDIASRATQTI
jgi:hypothetical protein